MNITFCLLCVFTVVVVVVVVGIFLRDDETSKVYI